MTGERHRVVLAGGSGSLGRRLADDLADRGVDVVVLSRNPSTGGRHRQVHWDGRSQGDWVGELHTGGPVSVVNLAGKLVDCRPTAANIAELTRSRVEPTAALVTAAAGLDKTAIPRKLHFTFPIRSVQCIPGAFALRRERWMRTTPMTC